MLVSELNADGAVKGLKLEYLADLVLSMKRCPDATDCVVIACTKARAAGYGAVGTFLIDWKRGRLVRAAEE